MTFKKFDDRIYSQFVKDDREYQIVSNFVTHYLINTHAITQISPFDHKGGSDCSLRSGNQNERRNN